jgi:Uma2 family endonuclease
MATEVVKRLINVEEYYKMAKVGILKPEDRVELINGEIYQMSPIGSRHAAIVDHLAMMLNQAFQHEAIVRVQNPIRIDDNNEPEPDVALVKYRSDFYSTAHPVPAEVLVVMEVAGSSITFDREIKSALYASCGIPEYWIIDMDQNRLEVFSHPNSNRFSQNKIYKPDEEVSLMGRGFAVKDILVLT